MGFFDRMKTGAKALAQLGFTRVWQYARYQAGLRSGFYRLRTPTLSISSFLPYYVFEPNWFFQMPNVDDFSSFGEEYKNDVIRMGEEVLAGKYRPFGGEPQKLDLELNFPVAQWTFHETGKATIPIEDIKLIWEPARLNWAVTLGKAYFFSHDERFAGKFRSLYQDFRNINPVNLGPNWQSAQEVALRLIALVIAAHLMQDSEALEVDFISQLCKDIADHAERILPTLTYAKAQDNNHLLSEAVGLYCAGLFLKDHPRSNKWISTGRELFKTAILEQIEEDGEYCQHSTNYHRMMLTLALWMRILLLSEGKDLEPAELEKLGSASKWLIGRFDEVSGQAVNLGHNDGSFILPFTNSAYEDYRPIIQAASAAFGGIKPLPDGDWNDLMIWLVPDKSNTVHKENDLSEFWSQTRLGTSGSWANLRARRYHNRPAHADQLHIDLWFWGHNVLLDAGTYLYNAQPPWMNALAATLPHNTVCVDGLNQMTRAGRFLWLDWAQADILESSRKKITAEHDGYRKLGITHRRELKQLSDAEWEVLDHLLSKKEISNEHDLFIYWLLPDWSFSGKTNKIVVTAPFGRVEILSVLENQQESLTLSVIRAGDTMVGDYRSPNLGWYSPTYNLKTPALSILYHIKTQVPANIRTNVSFVAE